MARVDDPSPDDHGTAGVFALFDALSIAIQGASAGSAAQRLDDLKRIQESLSTAGEQLEGHRLSPVPRIEALSNLAGEIPIAVPSFLKSSLAGGISIAVPSVLVVASISTNPGWAEAWHRSPLVTAAVVSWLVLGVIFIGLQTWLFRKGLERRSSELVRSRIEDSNYAELVRSRIEGFRSRIEDLRSDSFLTVGRRFST
jgi:hypothetical protein